MHVFQSGLQEPKGHEESGKCKTQVYRLTGLTGLQVPGHQVDRLPGLQVDRLQVGKNAG